MTWSGDHVTTGVRTQRVTNPFWQRLASSHRSTFGSPISSRPPHPEQSTNKVLRTKTIRSRSAMRDVLSEAQHRNEYPPAPAGPAERAPDEPPEADRIRNIPERLLSTAARAETDLDAAGRGRPRKLVRGVNRTGEWRRSVAARFQRAGLVWHGDRHPRDARQSAVGRCRAPPARQPDSWRQWGLASLAIRVSVASFHVAHASPKR